MLQHPFKFIFYNLYATTTSLSETMLRPPRLLIDFRRSVFIINTWVLKLISVVSNIFLSSLTIWLTYALTINKL